jgi:chemotaxis protein methyltransferase CheR
MAMQNAGTAAKSMGCIGFAPDLTDAQFSRICSLLYQHCGISLRSGKEALVRSRLMQRLVKSGLDNFDAYIARVENEGSGAELRAMVDALTTNKTSFFREPQHFVYLQNQLLPRLLTQAGQLRFLSAGCSTGQEPYTLAIILNEALPSAKNHDCRILATDISERVLQEARQGIYPLDEFQDMPSGYLQKYFTRTGGAAPPVFAAGDKLRLLIRFARLNLMENWPMRGLFDVIFCRNVMIYFDLPTRRKLVRNFARMLRPGGHLFVGHSESLNQLCAELAYVQPAVYVKCAG